MKTVYSVMLIFLLTALAVAPQNSFADDDHHGGKKEKRWFSSKTLGQVNNAAYLKECGACHFAYQPELLPGRSWEKIMNTLDNHFGDNAALDKATASEILNYLVSNSAENISYKKSRKIMSSLPDSETTLRITETAYFIRKHHEVSASVFKRKSIGFAGNCIACHTNADKGDYDEHGVTIPRN